MGLIKPPQPHTRVNPFQANNLTMIRPWCDTLQGPPGKVFAGKLKETLIKFAEKNMNYPNCLTAKFDPKGDARDIYPMNAKGRLLKVNL